MAFGIEKLTGKVERLTDRLTEFVVRRSLAIVLGALVLTGLSIYFMSRLELRSDFTDLLPQDFQSVRDLRRTSEKVGGLSTLSVALQSSDLKASERLADDIAALVDREFRDRILFYEYKLDEVNNFKEKYAPLYMDLDDLDEVRFRVREKIQAERKKKNPVFFNLGGEVAEEPKLDFKDIEAKYKTKDDGKPERYKDGYFTVKDEQGELVVLMLKPDGSNTDILHSQKLVADVERAIAGLNPKSYAPDMKVGLAGSYKIAIEEFNTLKDDIAGTALLCVGLVSLAVLLFFRSLRAVLFLGVTSICAVAWTFAITYFAIGYLNTVTAFLGAIIAGTGINYGIILLARYFEERRQGRDAHRALHTAMRGTILATIGASSTTALSFAIFLLAEVKSFSQFGFIGGIGIVLIWFASYTFLPAIITLSERIWPTVREKSARLLSDQVNLGFLAWPLRAPVLVVSVFAAGAIAAIFVVANYLPNSLEYDMSNLRTKNNVNSGTERLDARISNLFDVSMTPEFVLTESLEQGPEVCKVLLDRKAREGDQSGIETCRSIHSLLPEQQAEKLAIISDIKKLLNDRVLGFLEDDQAKLVAEWKDKLPDREVAFTDLPKALSRPFTDRQGNLGSFVFVYPRSGRPLYEASNLTRFTDALRQIELPNGQVITASGQAVIFADLLSLLKRDGPIATLASFLGVFLLVVISFGNLRSSLMVGGTLLVGTLWMLGLAALRGTKLNFFNFMALPMTVGIGVDYAINIYQRYTQEGLGSINLVLKRTGMAVFLCSLTTIIGYTTLIVADSQALASLGWLAILGEFTTLTAAMVGLPAVIAIIDGRRRTEPAHHGAAMPTLT